MFYVAHRLFAAHDRELGALAAAAIAWASSPDQVFLPFCDTDEEDLQADVKGRRLFDLDCERLPALHGMLAILHGPSLDDGVCMEIGYAAALGIPTVVLTTDFQTYGQHPNGPELAFADPLVEVVTHRIVRASRLDPPPATSTDRFRAYGTRNRGQLRRAVDSAVDHLLRVARPPAAVDRPATEPGRLFIEPSPYGPSHGWQVAVDDTATRSTTTHHRRRFHDARPLDAARDDWSQALTCDSLLVDVSGPETPPGAAMLIGAGVATGRRVIAYTPRRSWTFAHGREPNWRNLMIQYAVGPPFTDGDLSAPTTAR